MNRYPALIVFLLFSFVNILSAQTPAVVWQKCLGGNNGDYGQSVEQTTDGGFIMAGYTEGPDNGDIMGYHGNFNLNDIWVVKTDNAGNIQWQKCIGGNSFENGAWIYQTAEGGYVVAGTASSVNCEFKDGHGGTDFLLVKLNSRGDVVWQKLYGGSLNEYCRSLSLAPDGGYIMTGETDSNNGDITVNHGLRDYWVIKVDASGSLQWQKSLGGSQSDEAYDVKATADGGCVVVGYTESNDGDVTGNHGLRDYWVVKLNNTGNIQWQKALGGSGFEEAWSIALSNDGGYVVAGYSTSNDGNVSGNHNGLGPGDQDFWIVKLNSTGVLQWQKCYGGNLNEFAYSISPTQDGGYVVAGTAESNDGDLNCHAALLDGWVIKITGTGSLQWQKQIGGNYYDEPFCVRELADGSYIVLGETCSKDISGYHLPTNMGSCSDFWLVKLSPPLASPPAPILKIDPASANICAGAPATITASAGYAGLNPTFHWTRNGSPVGNNGPSFTATGLANGDLIGCSITNGGIACDMNPYAASDAVTIKINNNAASPNINISADNTVICGCATITFKSTVTKPGASPAYMWRVNNKPTGVITDYFTSSTLNPGDMVTCVLTDRASCIPNGAVFSNTIQLTMGTSSTPSVTINAGPGAVCTGSTITFTALPVNAGSAPGYQWLVNGSNSGTNNPIFSSATLVNGDIVKCIVIPDPSYACAGSGNAISNPVTINLSSKAMPSVSISSNTTTYCAGVSATFTASTANAGFNPSYQWQINGVNVGNNSKTYTNSFFVTDDVVSCTITTDPNFACTLSNTAGSNSIQVTVIPQVSPTASITPSVNDVCAGAPMHFDAIALNAGTAPSYQWMVNNAPVNNTGPAFDTRSLADGDQVYCSVTPGSGACSLTPIRTNTFIAVIEPTPVIQVSPKDTIISIGHQVQLQATITGVLDSYHWTPAEKLEDPFTMTPSTVRLVDNTDFQLTAISNKGCEASATVVVKVGRPLLMPNAFSPNNDGKNDVFRIPPGVGMQLDEFSIFDRWGNRVFTTNQIDKGWNGTMHGMPLDEGVFVYIIKGWNEKGAVLAKGTVVLIR
jgi:gliding motility-associated-like protein